MTAMAMVKAERMVAVNCIVKKELVEEVVLEEECERRCESVKKSELMGRKEW